MKMYVRVRQFLKIEKDFSLDLEINEGKVQ